MNCSMQVNTKSNHYLLWPLFTFKTASILLGPLSHSFIRKPAGELQFFCRRWPSHFLLALQLILDSCDHLFIKKVECYIYFFNKMKISNLLFSYWHTNAEYMYIQYRPKVWTHLLIQWVSFLFMTIDIVDSHWRYQNYELTHVELWT